MALTALVAWKVFSSHPKSVSASSQAPASSAARSSMSKNPMKSQILDRVRSIAQRRLPEVKFHGHEEMKFSQLDPAVTELDVMEILLAVETEFDTDIPEKSINGLVGDQNRRNLREHLSLSLIAELVEEVLPSAAH
jgi:acyl carrier protein